MCVKLLPRDLNSGSCSPHSTSTYTCGVTITPRACNDQPNFTTSKLIAQIFTLNQPKKKKKNHIIGQMHKPQIGINGK